MRVEVRLGVVFANNPAEAEQVASNLIGSTIKASIVKSLLVEEKLNIAAQFYAPIAIHRQGRIYIEAFTAVGVPVADKPSDIVKALAGKERRK